MIIKLANELSEEDMNDFVFRKGVIDREKSREQTANKLMLASTVPFAAGALGGDALANRGYGRLANTAYVVGAAPMVASGLKKLIHHRNAQVVDEGTRKIYDMDHFDETGVPRLLPRQANVNYNLDMSREDYVNGKNKELQDAADNLTKKFPRQLAVPTALSAGSTGALLGTLKQGKLGRGAAIGGAIGTVGGAVGGYVGGKKFAQFNQNLTKKHIADDLNGKFYDQIQATRAAAPGNDKHLNRMIKHL